MEFKTVNNWCKIFTLENGEQVLATKDYDSDEEKYLIRIETKFEIEEALVNPSINLNYDNEDDRNSRFEDVDLETATKSFKALEKEIIQMLS